VRRLREVTGPDQVWRGDITYLSAERCGLETVLQLHAPSVQGTNREAGATGSQLAFMKCRQE